MNDEKLKAANQNRRRKSEIEKEFEIWERELTEPRKLGYLQGWNKDHPVALNSCVSEELFNGFRLAVMVLIGNQKKNLNFILKKI